MINDIQKFLSKFIDLPADLAVLFEDIITYAELEPFEFFIKENEQPTDFFIIKTGLIRSYLETEDGKEVTRHLFTPGNTAASLSDLKSVSILVSGILKTLPSCKPKG